MKALLAALAVAAFLAWLYLASRPGDCADGMARAPGPACPTTTATPGKTP